MRDRSTVVLACLVLASLILPPTAGGGVFRIKLVAMDTRIAVGQETTLQVWGWADDPAAQGMNGIGGWDISLAVPSAENGILQVKPDPSNPTRPAITVLGPSPFDNYTSALTGVTFNTPYSGNVNWLGAVGTGGSSTTGVGGYSLLANITVKGLTYGTATYSVASDPSVLTDTWLMDGTQMTNWVLDPASVGTITVGPVTVYGVVSLVEFVGDYTSVRVTFRLQPCGGGDTIVRTIYPNADGSFALDNIPVGTYQIAIKGDYWLQTVLNNITISANPTYIGTVSVKGGDANGDNRVDFTDYSILQNNFGQSGKTGAQGDFDGDGNVDFADFSIPADELRTERSFRRRAAFHSGRGDDLGNGYMWFAWDRAVGRYGIIRPRN